MPVYTSLYRVHLAARITSVFTLTRPARDAVKLGIPYCIHAPIHTPPRNRTARATRPRNRGNVFLHASAAPSGAAAPLHRRASGWRAVLPREMHMVRLDSCFKTSNVPPRSDRIIVRGVGVAATRQRSRFPTVAHSNALTPRMNYHSRWGLEPHSLRRPQSACVL